ncbi:peptidase G2 autoproteolytic cleavage domain-containing protein [Magnetofaba australis]|uniref:Peptidase G2 IMC autoproteolytic cleavage domain-containing protein n=1 Tax=Magnetofaba australis IT-1 TaxID=1434232 RepID=A0A1Y2K222_9PROT|nr:peptidase G2 autoproteolytic cleavage domain-containing protein [Magnetofaba australis]OSM01656.1 hypothetical protein MAIT1_01673 [Magnetofaba australis IT-1]
MSLETEVTQLQQDIGDLVIASESLTAEVTGKINDINTTLTGAVSQAQSDVTAAVTQAQSDVSAAVTQAQSNVSTAIASLPDAIALDGTSVTTAQIPFAQGVNVINSVTCDTLSASGSISTSSGFDSPSVYVHGVAHDLTIEDDGSQIMLRSSSMGTHLVFRGKDGGGTYHNNFRISQISGSVDARGVFNASQSFDVAEMMEWADGNPDAEDRVGYSVIATANGKIRKAQAGETPIGVISGIAALKMGTAWDGWSGRYRKDAFLRPMKNADGSQVENPDYNASHDYAPRDERAEWAPVGLLGQVPLRKGQPTASNWIKMRDLSADVELWLVR